MPFFKNQSLYLNTNPVGGRVSGPHSGCQYGTVHVAKSIGQIVFPLLPSPRNRDKVHRTQSGQARRVRTGTIPHTIALCYSTMLVTFAGFISKSR